MTAPGGDFGPLTNNIVASPGGGCADITGGTSFSAPVVAGVIALMLQVNPNLGWRDVQAILAETASPTDPTDDSWTTNNNGNGLHVSYKYGFGLVDAAAAVEASRSWTNFGPERQLVLKTHERLNLPIADNANEATMHSQFVTDASEDFRTESVVVYLDLLHASRGDLLITITSPSGTESILNPSKRPENRQLPGNETWKLMTLRNWNENPNGDWTLRLVDENPGTRNTCANEPFEHLFPNTDGGYDLYNCLRAEAYFHCRNGRVRDEQSVAELVDRGRNNRTAAEACCVCGGGTPVSEVNMLRSWTMVIYGHDSLMNGEEGTMGNQDQAQSSPPASTADGSESPNDSSKNATIGNRTTADSNATPEAAADSQPTDLIKPTETDNGTVEDASTSISSTMSNLSAGKILSLTVVMLGFYWAC